MRRGYINEGFFGDNWEEVDIIGTRICDHTDSKEYLVKDKDGHIFAVYRLFEKKD